MIIRTTQHGSRSGYTLLEVVLSVALAVLLLGGLYVAMWAQYDQTEAGREVVEQATIARSLFRRISADILSHLPPVDPRLPAPSAGQAPAEEAPEGEEQDEAEMFMTEMAGGGAVVSTSQFNRGVLLNSDDLILLTTRVPREIHFGTPPPQQTDDISAEKAPVSDLRLVRYFLVADGTTSKGLARIEISSITSDQALQVAADEAPANAPIIAPEVKYVAFRFFGDQVGEIKWHDTWDGSLEIQSAETLDTMLFSTTPVAQVGPPAAVEITLKLGRLDLKEDVEANWKTFRHVVAIPTANGLTPLSEMQLLP